MPESSYPLRAAGDYAGTKCPVKTCTRYARFVVTPLGADGQASGTCAHHLAVISRTLMLITSRALVTQEVPGNWGKELVLADGVIGRLGNST